MAIQQENLSQRNYILCMDQSGSMGEPVSKSNATSRWSAAREATVALARKCAELDADGIDLYTFNTGFKSFANTTPDKVDAVFKEVAPQGGTDFVPVLTEAINNAVKQGKPATIVVVTDGEPSDGAAGQKRLEDLIINTTKKMEGDAELAIQFVQVGDDAKAATFLKHLDDGLQGKGAKFDIVDTKTCDELGTTPLADVLLAAVND